MSETAEASAPRGVVRRLLARGLVRAGIITYVFAGLTLVANLVTGVAMARALGPDGRGIAFALVTVSQLAGFALSMGVGQSLSYFIARRPEDGPTLLSTWVVMLLPLTALAIGITELLLPVIFTSDDGQAVSIGRWFMLTIDARDRARAELRPAARRARVPPLQRPAAGPARADGDRVRRALGPGRDDGAERADRGQRGLGARARRRPGAVGRAGSGSARSTCAWARTTLWYGARGQGATVANHVTARLDVAMLPAFVSAASVGLYSVATSVSLIVYQLANTFAGLVIPAAARDPERGPVKVVASFWASLAIAAAGAVVLALLAQPLLGLVYGADFEDASTSLLLLLPGGVLFAGSSILNAGIYAAGRPFTATATQILGMVVTVVGLVVFLSGGGVTAAAIVSSVSYATIFVSSLIAYRRVAGLTWGELVPTPRRVRALAREA